MRTAFVVLFLFYGLAAINANAAVCSVNTLADAGAGSGGVSGSGDLRYCIAQTNAASGADVIIVSIPGTVSLTSSLPIITDSLTINGNGQSSLFIDGHNQSGISPFEISASAGLTVNLTDLTIMRGNSNNPNGGGITLHGGGTLNLIYVTVDNNTTGAENGAGIIANGSALNLFNSRIMNNHMVTPGGAGAGIGLFGGTLTIKGSVISGNTLGDPSDLGGAGIDLFQVTSAKIENSTISNNINGNYGAGIKNEFSNLRMSNVTISNNSGGVQAGGLANLGGTAILRNCTIANNSVTRFGGGIYNGGNATLTIANTIIADNTAGESGTDFYNFASLIRLGNNIVRTAIVNSGTIAGAGTISNSDPHLFPLGNYGGSLATLPIGLDSAARNAGVNSEALSTDDVPQTLVNDARGMGFLRINDGIVDLGAFESPEANATFTLAGLLSGSGRVLTGHILVRLTDLTTGSQRFTVANPFGFFHFAGVAAGANVRIQVTAKGAAFTPQELVVVSDVTDLTFAAQPGLALTLDESK